MKNQFEYSVYDINSGNLVAKGSAMSCAEQLGMSRNAFYTFAFQAQDSKRPKYRVERVGNVRAPSKVTKYEIKARTGEILALGSSQECASQLGMTIHSFYSMVSRAKCGKNKRYIVNAVKNIDDQE